MNETAISWTVSNWITVFLMCFLGFMLVGGIAAVIHKTMNNKAEKQ